MPSRRSLELQCALVLERRRLARCGLEQGGRQAPRRPLSRGGCRARPRSMRRAAALPTLAPRPAPCALALRNISELRYTSQREAGLLQWRRGHRARPCSMCFGAQLLLGSASTRRDECSEKMIAKLRLNETRCVGAARAHSASVPCSGAQTRRGNESVLWHGHSATRTRRLGRDSDTTRTWLRPDSDSVRASGGGRRRG